MVVAESSGHSDLFSFGRGKRARIRRQFLCFAVAQAAGIFNWTKGYRRRKLLFRLKYSVFHSLNRLYGFPSRSASFRFILFVLDATANTD